MHRHDRKRMPTEQNQNRSIAVYGIGHASDLNFRCVVSMHVQSLKVSLAYLLTIGPLLKCIISNEMSETTTNCMHEISGSWRWSFRARYISERLYSGRWAIRRIHQHQLQQQQTDYRADAGGLHIRQTGQRQKLECCWSTHFLALRCPSANRLLQVCCCRHCGQKISIDCRTPALSGCGGRMRAVPRCQRT